MADGPLARFRRAVQRPGRIRRGARRRANARRTLLAIVRHDSFTPDLLIALALIVGATLIVGLTRSTPVLHVGRTMDATQIVRAPFEVEDTDATRSEQEMRRRNAPRVFRANEPVLDQIERSLRTLPEALSVAETFDQVADEYRLPFALDEASFQVVKAEAATPESVARWEGRVNRLMRSLRQKLPLLSKEDYQATLNAGTLLLELRAGAITSTIDKSYAVSIEVEEPAQRELLMSELRQVAESAGFFGPRRDVIVNRLLVPQEPTFLFDRAATEQAQREAAAAVEPVIVRYGVGDVVYRRGEQLTDAQFALAREENRRWRDSIMPAELLLYWGGILATCVVLAIAVIMYLGMYYPRALAKPWRFLAFAALLLVTVGVATRTAAANPGLFWFALSAPLAFASMMLVVAYDVRLALGSAGLMCMLACIALGLPLAPFAALWAGCSAAAWRLHDIRNRSDVVRAAVVTAFSFVACIAIASLLYRPLGAPTLLPEVVKDALASGAGGFLAGALTLVVLPSVERLFDIVTGMTLSELRDPRQPLLRELQNRAPGTFNHSHTVATLAEAAADAIGADSLHLYVGALYHDIGKLSKPEYFVENQSGGPSKHSKLSPAMSLLVIVGHVKDGLELAREYALPRSLHHYIESHHGTTLVEYFYDRARRQAEQDDKTERPSEVEYRYPGPKPQTREAAILMLCDAVESAARAMADPTPSRIGALVHELANKRLVDGQFDECSLTLGELNRIEDAVTKALCSIYHGRIAYPRDTEHKDQDADSRDAPAHPGHAASG